MTKVESMDRLASIDSKIKEIKNSIANVIAEFLISKGASANSNTEKDVQDMLKKYPVEWQNDIMITASIIVAKNLNTASSGRKSGGSNSRSSLFGF